MIKSTGKSLSDYFAQAGRKVEVRAASDRTGDPFSAALRQAMADRQPQPATPGTGLTIRDYLAIVSRPSSQPETTGTSSLSEATESVAVDPEASKNVDGALLRSEEERPAGLLDSSIRDASRKYRLSEALIRSVIRNESNFQPEAVSPAGAQGLMQLMPATARELGVENPFDIRQNIDGGSKYLRRMMDLFEGDLEKTLAAYNAGPGTVRRYDGVPPYPETRSYIRRVLSDLGNEPATLTA
ncbi:MAG: lytic transglycosylase domain-containing protein [Desulfobacterales bacterium]